QYTAYFLFGLDLATGNKLLQTNISPAGFDWRIQQERGALALSKDGSHVYVPFGGRIGDCGAYHAWVVGAPTNGLAPDELFEGPSTGAGSWPAGGVVVDDSTGHVFFSTGNAIPCSGSVFSDSVIETNATLGGLSNFQPLDWQRRPSACATRAVRQPEPGRPAEMRLSDRRSSRAESPGQSTSTGAGSTASTPRTARRSITAPPSASRISRLRAKRAARSSSRPT